MQGRKRTGKMIVIAIGNRKGGVGKSQTAMCTASRLTALGYKTLLIDDDGQDNASLLSGIDIKDNERNQLNLDNLYEEMNPLVEEITETERSMVRHAIQELDGRYYIIEAGLELNYAESVYTEEEDNKRLKKIVNAINDDFDFCIIDTPPNTNTLTVNALVAADYLVIPMDCDMAALSGLDDYCDVVDDIRDAYNPNLKIAGVLLTNVDMRTNNAKLYIKDINSVAQDYGTKAFSTPIRHRAEVITSRKEQQDFMTAYKKSDAAKDYCEFVDELLKDCEV